MSAPTVAVLAFDRISPFHLSVPCLVFGSRESPPCEIRVCACEPGPLTTTAGFSLAAPFGLEALQTADIVIVPSWRDAAERAPEALLAALASAHRRGVRVVGLCLGAYVLAQAGLLDGRRATTHWAWAEDFAARFPRVKLAPEVLYVEEDGLMTSAGTAAAIDCCLHLIREEHGAEVANRIARHLVVPPHREGGQAQFIAQPVPATPRDSRLAGLLDWVREHLAEPHSLDSLAARALMSRRTLTRHFRELTGTTVAGWLMRERLACAQRLLESGDQSVEQIAALVGFGSAVSLRQQFKRAFGVSPSAWRHNFRT